jgi:hypothetical protein
MRNRLFLLAVLLITMAAKGQNLPFQNSSLCSEERAKELISILTLEEKALLMCDQSDAMPWLWENYNGTLVYTISILDGIYTKLSDNKILYDKGCDLVEDKITQTFIDKCWFEGKLLLCIHHAEGDGPRKPQLWKINDSVDKLIVEKRYIL